MTHGRKTLRDKIVAKLVSASITGSRVYSNRFLALSADDLPAINVTASEETSTLLNLSQKTAKRELTLQVEIVAKENDSGSIDDTLDGLSDSVETAMAADFTFDGTALNCQLTETRLEVSTESETNVGTAKLTYVATYIY